MANYCTDVRRKYIANSTYWARVYKIKKNARVNDLNVSSFKKIITGKRMTERVLPFERSDRR